MVKIFALLGKYSSCGHNGTLKSLWMNMRHQCQQCNYTSNSAIMIQTMAEYVYCDYTLFAAAKVQH